MNRVVRHTLAAGVDGAPRFYTELFGWEPEMEQGEPPHWLAWVLVDDVDRVAARVEELGGRVRDNERGETIVTDPQGAQLGLTSSAEPPDPAGRFNWDELMTSDVERARDFYGGVFGWTSVRSDIGPSGMYTYFASGADEIAGVMEKLDYLATPTWLPYVDVQDIEMLARRARDLGAHLAVEPTPIIDYGWFAVLADPAGALLGLARPD